MRQNTRGFDFETLKNACNLAHINSKKVYLTANTLPRNSELPNLHKFTDDAVAAGVDAFIVADLGVFSFLKKQAPDTDIHISTQMGIVNYETARILHDLGAKRIVLARELSLDEIAEIRLKTPKELEIECFVHGAMCVSFSGRCLLSEYFTGRDANRGACAQPCRWEYFLNERTRDGQYFPILEDKAGTYILNSKDLCTLPFLKELSEAGIDSFKIEGRAKSEYYVAVVTNAYRQALDNIGNIPVWVQEEIYKISHREYTTGFYFQETHRQIYTNSSYIRDWELVAIVTKWEDGFLYLEQRNRFFLEEELEILVPNIPPIKVKFPKIFNEKEEEITVANIATAKLKVPFDKNIPAGAFIRKERIT
jgi:putative protease